MTEKRFTVVYDDIIDLGSIYDSETERFISVGLLTRTELICNLLNELDSENKELKADNKRMVKFIMSKGYSLKDYLEWLNTEVWV